VAIAVLTGIELPRLRFLVPYLTWPLMTPLVAVWARRFPLGGRRGLLVHLGLALCLAPLHGLTFRLVMFALGRGFPPWPDSIGMLVLSVSVELVLYFSTAWPIAAAASLRRAQEAELARARAEAELASGELDVTLGLLGPKQLDGLLGRLRLTIVEPAASADGAVSALATYLRAGLAAVETTPWTLDRELDAASSYLAFEQACSGRPVQLVVEPPQPSGALPVRRYSVVSAVTALVDSHAGPLRLRLRHHEGGCALRADDLSTRRPLAEVEVPP
jgi:hypothetical protein